MTQRSAEGTQSHTQCHTVSRVLGTKRGAHAFLQSVLVSMTLSRAPCRCSHTLSHTALHSTALFLDVLRLDVVCYIAVRAAGLVPTVSPLIVCVSVSARAAPVFYDKRLYLPTCSVGTCASDCRCATVLCVCRWAGPELGEHTEAVLTEELGYSQEKIQALRDIGAI